MKSNSNTRPLLQIKPMKALASAVLAVPLMACNYKGPAYDCADFDANAGLCLEQDAGVAADGGPLTDGGSIEDAGGPADVDSGTAEPEVDAGAEADAGEDGDAGALADDDAGAPVVDAGGE